MYSILSYHYVKENDNAKPICEFLAHLLEHLYKERFVSTVYGILLTLDVTNENFTKSTDL